VEGGNRAVRFGSLRPGYVVGQEVEVVVRLGSDLPPLAADAPARARIIRRSGAAEEVVAVVPLRRREAQPRVLEGKVRDLPQGDYRIEPDVPALADRLRPQPDDPVRPARFEVTPPDEAEMVDLRPDWDLLQKLSAAGGTGGRVFTAADAGDILALLKSRDEKRDDAPRYRTWEWWPTLVLLLLLLTVEWVGRKMAGLP
jgi:hypothetical protein